MFIFKTYLRVTPKERVCHIGIPSRNPSWSPPKRDKYSRALGIKLLSRKTQANVGIQEFGESAAKIMSSLLLSSWLFLADLIETPKMFSVVTKEKAFFMLHDLRGKDTGNFKVYYLSKDVSSMLHKNIHLSLAKQNYSQEFDNICVETKKWQTKFLLTHHLP